MGLGETQRLLARLYTDAELRSRFLDEPANVGAEFGLGRAESERLHGESARRIEAFAESLRNKRRGDAEKYLFMCRRALGDEGFAEAYRRYDAERASSGVKSLRAEAIGLARHIERSVALGEIYPRWLADLARYEAARLTASEPGCLWVARRLGRRVGDLIRAVEVPGFEPPGRPCLAIWFRLKPRGAIRHAWIG